MKVIHQEVRAVESRWYNLGIKAKPKASDHLRLEGALIQWDLKYCGAPSRTPQKADYKDMKQWQKEKAVVHNTRTDDCTVSCFSREAHKHKMSAKF